MQQLSDFAPRGASPDRSAEVPALRVSTDPDWRGPPRRRVTGALLLIGAMAAAAVLLGLSTTALTVSPRWRGALIGSMVGLYGLLLFRLGYTWSVRRRNIRTRSIPGHDRSGPTPEEAKFWLRKFLDEQQKK